MKKFLVFVLLTSGCSALVEKPRVNKPTSAAFGPVTEEAQFRVSRHEAAHAVVSAIVRPKYPVSEIVVQTEVTDDMAYGATREEDVNRLETVEDILAEAVQHLAGREAEIVLLGQPTNAGTYDLIETNNLLITMCTRNGLCGSLIVEKTPSPDSMRKVDQCLLLAQARAHVLVEANAETIDELGALILAQPARDHVRKLTAKQFYAFLKTRKLVTEAEAGHPGATTCP